MAPGFDSRAFYLMRPHPIFVRKVDAETGEEKRVQVGIRGFGWFAVHPYEHTEPIAGFSGAVYSLEDIPLQRREFVASPPLVEVAQAWGIHVTTYRGREHDAFGWAIPGMSIGLGVANLSTWAHELVHRSFRLRLRSASQAEHRLGALTVGNGHLQSPVGSFRLRDRENEIVAELGGAVLLTLLGHTIEADWGGAYRYIRSYARAENGEGMLKGGDAPHQPHGRGGQADPGRSSKAPDVLQPVLDL